MRIGTTYQPENSEAYGTRQPDLDTDAQKNQNICTESAKAWAAPNDEYISSEKSALKPTGLYRLGQDENGNPKISYDAPAKTAPKDTSPEKAAPEATEQCTGNTDNVDREIEKLKRKKQQLEQQIQAASGDKEKQQKLEQQLKQVELSLSQKDNDAYRRQHTTFMHQS